MHILLQALKHFIVSWINIWFYWKRLPNFVIFRFKYKQIFFVYKKIIKITTNWSKHKQALVRVRTENSYAYTIHLILYVSSNLKTKKNCAYNFKWKYMFVIVCCPMCTVITQQFYCHLTLFIVVCILLYLSSCECMYENGI